MKCTKHNWKKKTFPCPWINCSKGTVDHVFKRGKITYVRFRDKGIKGPIYDWRKDEKPS